METISSYTLSSDDFSYKHSTSTNTDNAQFKKHIHSKYEILFVKNVAPSEMNIEGKIYPMHSHTIIVIPPNKYHFLVMPVNCYYERFVINIEGELAQMAKSLSETTVYSIEDDELILQIFDKLAKYEKLFSKEENLIIAKNCVYEILVYLTHSKLKKTEFETGNSLIEKAVSYINDNLTSINSIDEIARALYVSKSTLCHTFNENMQISVMRYVRQKKIIYASALIKQGIKPTKACEMSGFENYTTFFRAYKALVGAMPKQK